jgi:hypothetical protein
MVENLVNETNYLYTMLARQIHLSKRIALQRKHPFLDGSVEGASKNRTAMKNNEAGNNSSVELTLEGEPRNDVWHDYTTIWPIVELR